MDELSLINASKKGDLDAFNRLVLAYQEQVYNLALRFLTEEDAAEDAAQISFISAYQNIHSFRGGSFRAWLLRIVTNNCYDELRRQKRKPSQPLEPYNPQNNEEIDDPVWLADDENLPEDRVIQKELDWVIQRCIENLPPDFRAVVLLVDVNGLDYKATSQTAHVPVGTVRSRLARARQRLQECLQDAWELLPEKYRLDNEGSS
jgi:RNA polymerase sigma-70 factor (ECF subfamily)